MHKKYLKLTYVGELSWMVHLKEEPRAMSLAASGPCEYIKALPFAVVDGISC